MIIIENPCIDCLLRPMCSSRVSKFNEKVKFEEMAVGWYSSRCSLLSNFLTSSARRICEMDVDNLKVLTTREREVYNYLVKGIIPK